MGIDFDTIKRMLQHRLAQADIEALLHGLSDTERAELFLQITELVRRTSALVDIAHQVSDLRSLDLLFPKLMQIVTETLNVERSSLFLYDAENDELFSRVLQGSAMGDVRFPASAGIAGSVFTMGRSEIVKNAYADPRFNREVDRNTGYRTRNILCAPIRSKAGETIGVAQALNKRDGSFDAEDVKLLEALCEHAASALQNAQLFEQVERAQREEALLLDVVTAIASEIRLQPLLAKIIAAATELLNVDRSTLFLYDPATETLFAEIAEGVSAEAMRFPAGEGVAGAAFSSGAAINIPDAYKDPRFNPSFDIATGYCTENILCMPIATKAGTKLGVIQALNKKDGPYTVRDERRLLALCAQAAISIENAQLFDAVATERNYNESILRSMSNGVLTLDKNGEVIKQNDAITRIFPQVGSLCGRRLSELFGGPNAWIAESYAKVAEHGKIDIVIDADVVLDGGTSISVNLTTVPLLGLHAERIGCLLVIEDITQEKRLRSTMSRYMSKAVVDRLLEKGEQELGGTGREATVLFSDIRGFSTITERLGAYDTVSLLNRYFTSMVDVVFQHGGILDKYIGDMIMAVFGSIESRDDDAQNAVAVAVKMMEALRELNARRLLAEKDPIQIRIGISTGQVIAGNIGSPKRMEYTVIGDRVNLAERLEEANKFYGTDILMCHTTVARLPAPADVREIDLVRVRGRSEPIAVYECLQHHTAESFPNLREVVSLFGEGMRLYRSRSWAAASAAFGKALSLHPGDGPSRIYLSRCGSYLNRPPSDDWDGVADLLSA